MMRRLGIYEKTPSKKKKYQHEVLIGNKAAFRKKYNIATIDKPSIDDVMLFYVKGEK